MAKGAGIRFLGRLVTEGSVIITHMAEGNIAGAAIDACQQTIKMVSSIVSYTQEANRTEEVRKQINYQKDMIKKGKDMLINAQEHELEALKEKLNIEYKKVEVDLKNKLEIYKTQVELLNKKAIYDFKEQQQLNNCTKKFCLECNNILDDIEKQLVNIQKLDNSKEVYYLMENYRGIQQQFNNLLTTQY